MTRKASAGTKQVGRVGHLYGEPRRHHQQDLSVTLLAIILAVSSGNPLAPLLRGGLGVIVWLVTIGLKRILADSSLRGSGR